VIYKCARCNKVLVGNPILSSPTRLLCIDCLKYEYKEVNKNV